MEGEYTDKELIEDLWRMVHIGLLDISIREDGEWVYSRSKKSLDMSPDEIEELLLQCDDLEYPFPD